MPAWRKITRAKLLSALSVALLSLGSCSPLPGAQEEEPFSGRILAAVRSMPTGGGYAADRTAEQRLAQRGITRRGKELLVSPQGAAPTFCSAACYMVLLQALQSRQADGHPLPPAAWASLRVEAEHPDGYLNWGRANANGPGFAKWIHDLGAGISFCEVSQARPGDFLKYFHTPTIGGRERGHLVIFLGSEQRGSETYLHIWSANRPQGYGTRSIPLSSIHHPIFTRITRPERFAAAAELPLHDAWLASLLHTSAPFSEVLSRCGIHTAKQAPRKNEHPHR